MDLKQYVGKRREELVQLGRLWGSLTVQEQANAFLALLIEHEEVMAQYGILTEDRKELALLEALYPKELEGRTDKKLGNTLTNKTLQEILNRAYSARRGSRSLLVIVQNRLGASDIAGADPEDALDERLKVELILQATARKPREAQSAREQLRVLSDCLALPITAQIAAQRGADRLQKALKTSITALDSAIDEVQQQTSTAEQTEQLDLIDGLIVERLREIARVAKTAAKEEGRPQLAVSFRLSILYA